MTKAELIAAIEHLPDDTKMMFMPRGDEPYELGDVRLDDTEGNAIAYIMEAQS